MHNQITNANASNKPFLTFRIAICCSTSSKISFVFNEDAYFDLHLSRFPLSLWAAASFEYIFSLEMCCFWKCYTTGTLIYPYSLFIRLLFVLQYIKSKCISWACPLNTIFSPTKRFSKAKEINEYFTTTKTQIFKVKKKKIAKIYSSFVLSLFLLFNFPFYLSLTWNFVDESLL